ncbi:hypothetical protein DFH07DRAFT_927050 [Mycena maculata]|uniref:Uncharacterized protein n=1 Tax=Mycena maculata TaxID=230809 RepID=A0AAD7ICM8_9AGAR|nr:hypothetical protein DFH07DRAFT_927050 [Mycena maculata]
MLWASKRRKSRPNLDLSSTDSKDSLPPPHRRASLGNPRFPFAPLDPQGSTSEMSTQQNLYARPIMSVEEQQRLDRQSPSPPPNFSLPRRDLSSSSSSSPSSSSSSSSSRRDPDMIYTTNSLASFAFGSASVAPLPPSPGRGRNIGPLDEDDEYERRADETPRPSLAGTPSRHDPRTPSAYYSPNAARSDAASHHTFGTSSASHSRSSLSLGSPAGRSRTTSNTTHASQEDLGGVTFNAVYAPPPPLNLGIHHHPGPGVEFDSEEEFSEEYADEDAIEVSSARGEESVDGPAFDLDAAFERQVYSDPLTLFNGGRRPSLPMAIPAITGSSFSDEGRQREREGSLATLRRPSRSLDDQGVLSAGAPPGSTAKVVEGRGRDGVSVPETDGDWRSLSARTTPSMSVVPTFAAPTFGAPESAGAGGVDGFGFDLDWSAMRAGITGLDMNDIAVHSSPGPPSSAHPSHRRPSQLSLMLRRPSTASGGGSVMYDPDTFSAAVRGWGGEEYERQRKYWTFRRDAADGRGGGRGGVSSPPGAGGRALGPVRSITSGRVGKGSSILSGVGGASVSGVSAGGAGERKHTPWRGMALNAEEIWNSSLVGGFKVRRIELRPQKPQQRVTIDPFRGPYTLGPKPPHDGAYTNIHKHSKVMAFSIHRHYKPARAPTADPAVRGSVSGRGSVSHEERRRPTAMILLAPRHVQEAYTSTNTTKGLRSHGLLDEGRDRGTRDREDGRRRDKDKEREREREREKDRSRGSKAGRSQISSAGSTVSTYRDNFGAPPPTQYTYPPQAPAPLDAREGGFMGPARSASASRRRRRNSLGVDSDSDTERVSSRTTHNEAFSTMDALSIDQMVLAQDARSDGANGVLSRVLRRGPAHPTGPAAPHSVYIPPWVTLQSRVKQEERRRRHDVLSNSFEDVGLLPPKKSSGGVRTKKAPVSGVDIFAQVPRDALFMLLPLWPGPTDPVSERAATRAPHEIPTEQRQYLLVSYKPTDERPPSRKHDGAESSGRKKGSSHSSPTSSGDGGGGGRGCDILLSSYHISARLVSHADLQGSGVRVPDEGLAVLGPWHEAWLTMPQIATRDHGLLVIGTCATREAGIEFDPEGLVKMGLCIPVPPVAATDEEEQEEPVAELTPIGKAVLEMAWIGCIAVSSFGPAASS